MVRLSRLVWQATAMLSLDGKVAKPFPIAEAPSDGGLSGVEEGNAAVERGADQRDAVLFIDVGAVVVFLRVRFQARTMS
jgi:hypothetical protein